MNTNADCRTESPRADSWFAFCLALLVPLLVTLIGYVWWQFSPWEKVAREVGSVDSESSPLREFQFAHRNGELFQSDQMRGQVWVVTYFFTSCPGSCEQLNQGIQRLHSEPELRDITWVSITCDPETDTHETLRSYADRFEADPERWLFCRSDLKYTQQVANGMRVRLARRGHQEDAIVIDKSGHIRGKFDVTSDIERRQLRAKLLECLSKPSPEEATEVTADTISG